MEIEDLKLLPSDDEFAIEDDQEDDLKENTNLEVERTPSSLKERDNAGLEEEMEVDQSDGLEDKFRRRRERFGTVDEESREKTSSLNRNTSGNRRSRVSRDGKSKNGRSKPDQNYNKARLLKPLYEGRSMDPDILAREIAYRLEERKGIVIKNVVRVLGRSNAIELFEETVRLQRGRGIDTADGKRRRTSGGVFLYLLKERSTKEEWNEIFKEDKEITKEKERRKRKLEKEERLAQRKEELLKSLDDISRNDSSEGEIFPSLDCMSSRSPNARTSSEHIV